MSKDKLFSILRSILAVAGALLMGKVIGGASINEVTWETFVGGAMGVISVAWSFIDKTSTIEAFQGAIRNIVTFLGSFLVSAGKLNNDTLKSIIEGTIAISPIIYGFLSRLKSQRIAKGETGIADLSGVKKEIPLQEIQPVLKTPPAA